MSPYTSTPDPLDKIDRDIDGDWVWQHITDNLRKAIGEELWETLETLDTDQAAHGAPEGIESGEPQESPLSL